MIKWIIKNHPKQKFIVTDNALCATTTIINICKKKNWYYIFNLKPDRLKQVNEVFEDNINFQNECPVKNYYLSPSIKFNGNIINALKIKRAKKLFLDILVVLLCWQQYQTCCFLGRKRWKSESESEGFYTKKHRITN